jgi:hypothetical protein
MTGLRVGESLTVPFVKSRGSPNNPTQGFDAAWLDDPQLRLPAGRWRVIALFHPLRRGCDSVIHDLDAGLEILVQE